MLTLILELICQWCCRHGLNCVDHEFRCDGHPTCMDRCREVNCTGTDNEGLLQNSS
jgi:hypothetical protein